MEDLKEYKLDIEAALNSWTKILRDLSVNLAYAKGSAIKPWDSPIDYVPILSDIDIHINLSPMNKLDIGDALRISELYEETFKLIRPNYSHIPRPQIMLLSRLHQIETYVPPDYSSVKFLIGTCNDIEEERVLSVENLREIDKNTLLAEKNFIQEIPIKLFDRIGLDYWQFLRQIVWRIGPTPTRVLSQFMDDPFKLWSLNRSSIHKLLLDYDLEQVADPFYDFYSLGWELFNTNFTDNSIYRKILKQGYLVLKESFSLVESL